MKSSSSSSSSSQLSPTKTASSSVSTTTALSNIWIFTALAKRQTARRSWGKALGLTKYNRDTRQGHCKEMQNTCSWSETYFGTRRNDPKCISSASQSDSHPADDVWWQVRSANSWRHKTLWRAQNVSFQLVCTSTTYAYIQCSSRSYSTDWRARIAMILTPSRFFLSKIAIGPAVQLETKQYVYV